MTLVTTEPRAPLMSGGRISPVVPQSMDDAYRLGKAVVMAKMAPRGLDTPEACMIAIMHGMELGLAPMTALQRIAVVNGRPTIWGDGAMALVRGSGLCEWVEETITGEGDKMVATCTTKRKGEPKAVARQFTAAEAKQAGLWGKSGPWQQFARRMLQMRARAFCLRDVYADVLGGLYLKEEMDHEGDERQERRRPSPPPPAAIEHQPATDVDLKVNTDAPAEEEPATKKAPPPPAETQPAADKPKNKKAPPPPAQEQPAPAEEDQTDWTAELEAFDNACGSAESAEEITEAVEAHAHLFDIKTPVEVGKEADKIKDAQLARIERQG